VASYYVRCCFRFVFVIRFVALQWICTYGACLSGFSCFPPLHLSVTTLSWRINKLDLPTSVKWLFCLIYPANFCPNSDEPSPSLTRQHVRDASLCPELLYSITDRDVYFDLGATIVLPNLPRGVVHRAAFSTGRAWDRTRPRLTI
jgi:hypothetical protein